MMMDQSMLERRREINRKAARKSRSRQKEAANQIRRKYCDVQSTNTKLIYERNKLIRERNMLKNALRTHRSTCSLANLFTYDDDENEEQVDLQFEDRPGLGRSKPSLLVRSKSVTDYDTGSSLVRTHSCPVPQSQPTQSWGTSGDLDEEEQEEIWMSDTESEDSQSSSTSSQEDCGVGLSSSLTDLTISESGVTTAPKPTVVSFAGANFTVSSSQIPDVSSVSVVTECDIFADIFDSNDDAYGTLHSDELPPDIFGGGDFYVSELGTLGLVESVLVSSGTTSQTVDDVSVSNFVELQPVTDSLIVPSDPDSDSDLDSSEDGQQEEEPPVDRYESYYNDGQQLKAIDLSKRVIATSTRTSDSTRMSGSTRMSDSTRLSDLTQMSGSTRMSDSTRMSGSIRMSDSTLISGSTQISGSTRMSGSTRLSDLTRISDSSRISYSILSASSLPASIINASVDKPPVLEAVVRTGGRTEEHEETGYLSSEGEFAMNIPLHVQDFIVGEK